MQLADASRLHRSFAAKCAAQDDKRIRFVLRRTISQTAKIKPASAKKLTTNTNRTKPGN